MCNPQRSDLFVQKLVHGWQAKEVNADGKKDEKKSHLSIITVLEVNWVLQASFGPFFRPFDFVPIQNCFRNCFEFNIFWEIFSNSVFIDFFLEFV